MSPPRLVLLDSFTTDRGDRSVWRELENTVDFALHPRTAQADVAEKLAGAELALTNKVVLDGPLLDRCPQLRYVGVLATGTNVVDLAAAKARGVAVTNVPGYSTASVAQLVFAFVLHFSHGVAAHSDATKAGAWHRSGDFSFQLRPLRELEGKRFVVVGSGAIGRNVGVLAEAFGMRVVRAQVPGSPTREGRVPLIDALREADVVSLHCPLTPETRNLVDEKFLGAMGRGSILINTGRGALISEPALVRALEAGHLAGVALDVLAEEPPQLDHPLLGTAKPWSSRVVVTPHLGWATIEARQRLVHEVSENVRAYLRGEARNRVA